MAFTSTNLDNRSHTRSTQDGHLPRINAVCPVLPGMVHPDDAVYDGLVDALQTHPRAAEPEGNPSGGQRPSPPETCRRDKGDASSAASQPPAEAGGCPSRGREAWGGPAAAPGRRCEARGGARPAAVVQGGAPTGWGWAGAGAAPSPYPPRSGGTGTTPASAARPEPRRRPPPSRRARRVAPPRRHRRGRPPAAIPRRHGSDWLPRAAALESGAVSQGRRPPAAAGTGAGRPPQLGRGRCGGRRGPGGRSPARRRQAPPGGAEVLAAGGASGGRRGPWGPGRAGQRKPAQKTSGVISKKRVVSFIEC